MPRDFELQCKPKQKSHGEFTHGLSHLSVAKRFNVLNAAIN